MITTKELTEKDAQRVERFKELMTVSAKANELRQALTSLYFNYTRLLVMHGENFGMLAHFETDSGLSLLSELIELLEDEPLLKSPQIA